MKEKESGVLLHITSLPGKYGIGTIGKEAYKFIDFLSDAGFSYWEILPIDDVGFGNSPFQVITAAGFNPLLIDLELLVDDGLLNIRDFQGLSFGDNPRKIDFELIIKAKEIVLKKAFKRFDNENEEFKKFKKIEDIEKYALYKTIKKNNGNKAWFDYSLEDRYFDQEVKEHYYRHHEKEIEYQLFLQFIFYKQWKKLHEYAKSKHIEIIGDLPHFLGYDSDAMYFNPELFMVDKRNLVTFVAGFPPDNFNSKGQKWGYPIYDWEYMRINNYKWWKKRLARASILFDRVKLNHFRGFNEIYAIPFRVKNAKKGKFIDGPKETFFKMVGADITLIASSLGTHSDEVEEFVTKCNLPSLKVLMPALFDFATFPDLTNLKEDIYLYLGNHDNFPIKSKLEEMDNNKVLLKKSELLNYIKEECEKENVPYFDGAFSNYDIAFKLIELIYASNAIHVSLTLQDMLYKGKESRMNIPSSITADNWTYRFLSYEINDELKNKFLNLNKKYKRANKNNIKN